MLEKLRRDNGLFTHLELKPVCLEPVAGGKLNVWPRQSGSVAQNGKLCDCNGKGHACRKVFFFPLVFSHPTIVIRMCSLTPAIDDALFSLLL